MTIERASDNPFPSILMVEGDPEALATDAAVGQRRLAVGTDHLLYLVDDAGVATEVGGSSGLADPMTTRGDIIVRNASNVTARLAVGASGRVLTSDGTDVAWTAPAGGTTLKVFRVTKSGTQTLTTGSSTLLTWETDTDDPDGIHFTSVANLTGTAAKTASSAAVVGTGTSFTTELTVGQVISIPGTAAEVRVVSAITNNTNLTVATNFANTASGQTVARKSQYIGVLEAAYWMLAANVNWSTAATGERFAAITRVTNDVTTDLCRTRVSPNSANETEQILATVAHMAIGDCVYVGAFHNAGANRDVAATSTFVGQQTRLG